MKTIRTARWFFKEIQMGRKLFRYFTSMQFGLILLGLIIAISVIGTLIPQNNEVMYYVRTYPDFYPAILSLHLNRIFSSWYFLVLTGLLCFNLSACIIQRAKKKQPEPELPETFTPAVRFAAPGDREKLKEVLESFHCRSQSNGSLTRYTRHRDGAYGSFLLHLGILLTVLFWALGSAVPKIQDRTCMPGESIVLEDGTDIHVESFSIEDENGRLDYASDVVITLADGRSSGTRRVSVNHPAAMGDYKIYQQTYGTKGKLTVRDESGHTDSFWLDSQDFLSADGENGIWFDDLYPGYRQDDKGALTFITSTSGRYENPVYVFVLRDHERSEQMLAFPGDSVTIDQYTFTFEQPVEYPGLRIKKAPAAINLFLLLSVILLIIGFYMVFFLQPVNVLMNEEGYTVSGRNEELDHRIHKALMKEDSNA